MRSQATICLDVLSERYSQIVFKALEPETRDITTFRSKVRVNYQSNRLLLNFEARDTSALRAAVNSYMQYADLAIEVLSLLERITE